MAITKRTWATLLAIVAAAGLIFLAYAYGKPPAASAPVVVNAASTNALLATLASKDSDGDGLPDWEEALYGTDPHKVDTFGYGMTDAEAVAKGLIVPKVLQQATSTDLSASIPSGLPANNSLTDQFGKALFAQYLQAAPNGTQLSQADMNTFLTGALGALNAATPEQDSYAASQMKVQGTGPDALRQYAADAEAAFGANTVSANQSELAYFRDALQQNDPASLTKVAEIGAAYTKIAAALAKMPVPSELEQYHLALVNAFARLGTATSDMALIGTDPLRSALGVSRYQADSLLMLNALSSIAQVFGSESVTLVSGEKGYYFYATAKDAETTTQSAPSPTPTP
ncbi:MAG: hypothetical protein KGI41_04230 [Patescibacteria group bacterium]|nr:hypothetical protein [Patescibacteria group bacterium]